MIELKERVNEIQGESRDIMLEFFFEEGRVGWREGEERGERDRDRTREIAIEGGKGRERGGRGREKERESERERGEKERDRGCCIRKSVLKPFYIVINWL